MKVRGKTLGRWLLLADLATILYLCFRIMQPFLLPAFLAVILSILLLPIYDQLASKLKGRRGFAAFLVCIGLTFAILLPVLFISVTLANEANDAYHSLKNPETI